MTAAQIPAVADGLRPHDHDVISLQILVLFVGNETDCSLRLLLCYFDSGAKKLNGCLVGKKHTKRAIKSKRALNPDTMKAFGGHLPNLHDLPVRQKRYYGGLIFFRRFVVSGI
jgi:hypothetical protein